MEVHWYLIQVVQHSLKQVQTRTNLNYTESISGYNWNAHKVTYADTFCHVVKADFAEISLLYTTLLAWMIFCQKFLSDLTNF